MKYLILLLLLLTNTSCGKEANLHIEPEFYSYVMKFKMYADNKQRSLEFHDLTMTFENLPSTYCGVCSHTTAENPKIIKIDHSCWDGEEDLNKEELIFHELGHCLLDRDHNTALRADKTPVSIMYPYVIGHVIYEKYYQDYIDELFR